MRTPPSRKGGSLRYPPNRKGEAQKREWGNEKFKNLVLAISVSFSSETLLTDLNFFSPLLAALWLFSRLFTAVWKKDYLLYYRLDFWLTCLSFVDHLPKDFLRIFLGVQPGELNTWCRLPVGRRKSMKTFFCFTIWFLFFKISEQIGLKNAAHCDKALLRPSFSAFCDERRHVKHVFMHEIPAFRKSVVLNWDTTSKVFRGHCKHTVDLKESTNVR